MAQTESVRSVLSLLLSVLYPPTAQPANADSVPFPISYELQKSTECESLIELNKLHNMISNLRLTDVPWPDNRQHRYQLIKLALARSDLSIFNTLVLNLAMASSRTFTSKPGDLWKSKDVLSHLSFIDQQALLIGRILRLKIEENPKVIVAGQGIVTSLSLSNDFNDLIVEKCIIFREKSRQPSQPPANGRSTAE